MEALAQDRADERRRLAVRASAPELRELSRSLEADFGPDATRRIRAGIELLLADERPPFPNPLQRPALFFLPELPADPFPALEPGSELDRFVAGLEARFAAIRQDLAAARAADYTDYLGDAYMRAKFAGIADDQWQTAPVYGASGWRLAAPALAELAGAFEGIVSGEIIVSRLRAGTAIPPHVDDNNYQLTIHLGLRVPAGDCAIRVGGVTRRWDEGRCLAFHDSFVHEVWNRTPEPRDVLLIDTWSPHVTPVERAAIQRLRRVLYRSRGAARAAG